MWSTNKKDRFLRSTLMLINSAACIALIYVYITYVGKNDDVYATSYEAFIQPEKLVDKKCIPVCVSRACMQHANIILRNVNSTADPCENFHTFLCSGFLEKFGLEEKGNILIETAPSMTQKLKGILDNLQAAPGSASEKMKTVYDSCVNYGSSELQGINELKNFLNDLGFSNWPYLAHDFNGGDANISTTLGKFLAYGAADYMRLIPLFGDETQEGGLLISFDRPKFETSTEISQELAVSMLGYFDLEAETIDTIIQDHQFVRNSILDLFKNNKECEIENCTHFQVDCSRLIDDNWLDLCETLRVFFNLAKIEDPIIMNSIKIYEPEDIFFKNLFSLLRSFPNRSLANFISMSFFERYQSELNFYFRLLQFKQKSIAYGVLNDFNILDRWNYCVRWIAIYMKLPLVNEFFHQYLTKSVTDEIINAFNDHSSEILNLMTFQEWIPGELKFSLIDKVKNVTLSIEELSRIFPNDSYVNKMYEKFFFTSESFLKNVLQVMILKRNVIFSMKSYDDYKYEPHSTGFEVQAYFGGSVIDINLGMLIPPIYIPNHISLIDHALLGPIISHEFGHLIYDTLEYKLEDNEKFREKRKCIADQFSRFKFDNLNENLNGSRYASENFPDNVGTSLIDKNVDKLSASEDITLPGVPYSTEQILYMSATQMWCSKTNLEKDLLYKNKDFHAPGQFRVNGIIQNSRGHSKAFQCSEGSFMNPTSKCSLLDAN